MATTLLNPTLWLLLAIIASATAAAVRREPAAQGLTRILSLATRLPILAIFCAAAAGAVGSRLVIGYVSPGSYAEEVLAARSFLTERQLYRGDDRTDFSRWMSEDPAPIEPWALPGMTVCEANAIGSRPELYTAQGHSPVLLLSSVPVVALGGGRALYCLLALMSVAALLAIAGTLMRSAGLDIRSAPGILLIAALLAWQPALAGIRQGDAVILVAGLVASMWGLLRHGQPSRAGLVSGLAASLLSCTAVLFVPLGLHSRRVLLVAVATLFVAIGATLAVAGPLIIADYAASTTASARLYSAAPMAYSAGGQLFRIGTGTVRPFLWTALGLLAISLCAAVRLRRESRAYPVSDVRMGRPPLDLSTALFAALAFLLLPVAWSQHVTLLVLPIAVLLGHVVVGERPWRLALLGAIVLLLSLPDQAVGRLGIVLHLSGGPEGITWLPPVPIWAAVSLWLWLLAAHFEPRRA